MVIERAPLEDELGDVLEKALRAGALNENELALRTGISAERIADAIDYRGEFTGEELDRLAAVLVLNPVGLRAVAGGRYPLPEIAGLPCCLFPLRMPYGIGVANAYVVADCCGDSGVLFDSGTDAEALRRVWPEQICRVEAVCLTHFEAEHTGGLAEVRRRWGNVPIFGPAAGGEHCNAVAVGDGGRLELAGFEVSVWRTPGHSEAHNCYVVRRPTAKRAAPLLVSGDLLFAGSVGGAYFCRRRLAESLQRMMSELPRSTVVAPGHGPLTTLENEQRHNPFLRPDV